MTEIFQMATRPNQDLFFGKNDANDIRLGEIVSSEIEDYADSEIVILGCPQDEGVERNNGRIGAALAPDAIRTQFYKLTNFGIIKKIFDFGDTIIRKTLEETHETHAAIVRQILKDGKKIVVLGGGNDISYADGRAMAEVFGAENWFGINIDAHFDVRGDSPPNSGTPYRQLLEEKMLEPRNFCEIGYQPHVNSPVYFDYLIGKGANILSLTETRRFLKGDIDGGATGIEWLFGFEKNSQIKNIFFGFDVDAVRASDAPGVSASSPIGLTAGEFIEMVGFAGRDEQTRIVEFTEMNPNFDIDNRTAKLVAVAVHNFCASNK